MVPSVDESENAAVSEYVRVSLHRRGYWGIWLRCHRRSGAALAGSWDLYAAHAESFRQRDEKTGGLPLG